MSTREEVMRLTFLQFRTRKGYPESPFLKELFKGALFL